MKKITYIFLCMLFLLVARCFADSDTAGGSADRRLKRYPRQRYYTKTINVFDEQPEKELEIPELDERAVDENPPERANTLLNKDLSSPAPPPRVAPGNRQMRGGKEDERSDNWLLQAIMDPSGTSGAGKSESDDISQENWGWLANEVETLAREMESLEGDDEDLSRFLSDEEISELRQFMLQRGLAVEDLSEADKTNIYSNTHRSDMFVDHDKAAIERFQIFNKLDLAPKTAAERDDESRKADEDLAEFDVEIVSNREIGAAMKLGNPEPESLTPKFLDEYRGANIEESDNLQPNRDFRGNTPHPSRDRYTYQAEPSNFRSAFDNDMTGKFKSAFDDGFRQRSINPPENPSYNRPEYSQPLRPIDPGAHESSFSAGNSFDNTSGAAGRAESLRDTQKKLPYSVRQWD